MSAKYKHLDYAALLGIVLIAIALRVFTLDSADLVQDENFTALFYKERAQGFHNSLIYFLIEISQSVLGENNTALRLPTFLFGIAGIIAIFFLGKELCSPSVGLLSAAILTLLPWHLFHSQYARYFASVVFFTILLHLFFLRAFKRDSIPYLLAAAAAAGLAFTSHMTAVLAPMSLWFVCVFMYFRYPYLSQQFSRRLIRFGFWAGVAAIILTGPYFFSYLSFWTAKPGQFSNSAAQLIFEFYSEAGVLLLLSIFAIWTACRLGRLFLPAYFGITIFLPIALIVAGTFVTSIRGDYGICFVVPTIVAASTAIRSVWHSPTFGRELSILLVLLVLANASPRLLSHYTDRLSENASGAASFLLENMQPGDRVSVFFGAVRFYLERESVAVERDGLGSPYSWNQPWPREDLAPRNERLWLVFQVTRDDLGPAAREWLHRNNAVLVWRKVSPRLDHRVGGAEIFLVCPPNRAICANELKPWSLTPSSRLIIPISVGEGKFRHTAIVDQTPFGR